MFCNCLLTDGVAVGVGVLLPDGDELGSKSEADDCNVDFLAHEFGECDAYCAIKTGARPVFCSDQFLWGDRAVGKFEERREHSLFLPPPVQPAALSTAFLPIANF